MKKTILIEDTYLGKGLSISDMEKDIQSYFDMGYLIKSKFNHPAAGLIVEMYLEKLTETDFWDGDDSQTE